MLETFFPVDDLPALDTIQHRTLQVAAGLERDARVATPTLLHAPTEAETIALPTDSDHVRAVPAYQVRTFEVVATQARNDKGQQIVFSTVPVPPFFGWSQLRPLDKTGTKVVTSDSNEQ